MDSNKTPEYLDPQAISPKLHDVDQPRPDQGITPVQQMISSCTGAFITAFMVTPLDVVKIRLQSQQRAFQQGSCFIYSNGLMDCLCMCSHCTTNGENGAAGKKGIKVAIKPWYNKTGHFTGTLSKHSGTCHLHGCENYGRSTAGGVTECLAADAYGPRSYRPTIQLNGTLDAFVKIARNEGLAALWSGLPPSLVMSIPATVFYFTTYDHLKYHMGYRDRDPNTQYVPLVAGSAARVGTVILISPLELIRTKMQSQQLSYREVGKAVSVSLRSEGISSLMRGVGPTILRDVPFSAIYWFSYEYFKSLQMRREGNTQVTFTQSLIAGATGGSIAGLLTLPFDVIKTHRQIQLGEAEMMKNSKVVTTYSLMKQLYKQQGTSALFAGLVPRLTKIAPACAIMISTYEYFKAFFRQRNQAASDAETAKSWS